VRAQFGAPPLEHLRGGASLYENGRYPMITVSLVFGTGPTKTPTSRNRAVPDSAESMRRPGAAEVVEDVRCDEHCRGAGVTKWMLRKEKAARRFKKLTIASEPGAVAASRGLHLLCPVAMGFGPYLAKHGQTSVPLHQAAPMPLGPCCAGGARASATRLSAVRQRWARELSEEQRARPRQARASPDALE
jgi:hypothetical protein